MRVRARGPRTRPALFGAVAATLALGSCAGAASGAGAATAPTVHLVTVPHGTLTIGIDQAPTGCNPDTATGDTWADQMLLEPVLPSVSFTDAQGLAVDNAALIESAELVNTDPQTVVYTLNPKAVWSDGVPITADDFAYAWREQRSATDPAGTPTDTASVLGYRDIASVTGSNDGRTVTVVFKDPYTDWQLLFSDLLPAHVLERTGWDPACGTLDPAVDVSGGPFVVRSAGPRGVTLAANPRWWGPTPALGAIDVKVASGPAQLARWLARGTVQVAAPSEDTPAFLLAVTADPALSASVTESATVLQLAFSATSPVTAPTLVREAIAHAVDRQALVDTETEWSGVVAQPATSHIYAESQQGYPAPPLASGQVNPLDPPTTSSTTTTTTPPPPDDPFPVTADPAAVARDLSEVGDVEAPDGTWRTPSGDPVTLRLTWDGADQWAARSATLLAGQLQAAGFAVALVPAPSAAAAGLVLAGGGADLAVVPYDALPDESAALGWYSESLGPPGQDGSEDWGGFDDPMVTALLEASLTAPSPTTALDDDAQADALLWSDMATLPLFTEPSVLVWSRAVAGIGPNAYGPSLLWSTENWAVLAATSHAAATPATAPSTTAGPRRHRGS